MFLSIFNYMLAHVPGFIRPAVNWLLDGLRSITGYIGQRWNAVGHAVDTWLGKVIFWGQAFYRGLVVLAQFSIWLIRVRIPMAISIAVDAAINALAHAVQAARDFAAGLVAGLQSWAISMANMLAELISGVRDFAQSWIDRIRVAVSDLIRSLLHVLQGPEVLAEWLVAAMWRAFAKFVAAQRDRIALWLTRESVSFTQWLTREIEDIILRWL